jgi:hypothetical protein
MREIVDRVFEVYDQELYSAESRQKVSRYIEILVSTGKRDPGQLTAYGLAYLKELKAPDPRYSGC